MLICRYSESATAINYILEDWVTHREDQRVSYVDCSHLYIIEDDEVCSFHCLKSQNPVFDALMIKLITLSLEMLCKKNGKSDGVVCMPVCIICGDMYDTHTLAKMRVLRVVWYNTQQYKLVYGISHCL